MKPYLIIKYIFDFLIAIIAIIILSPFFLVLSLIIAFDSKGPIFFIQKRIGANSKIFPIIKFRTLKIETPKDTPTHLLDNPDYYVTRVGRFLRKTSLDEIPQVFNIFLCQMSIVGPRPALWNQDDLMEERKKYGADKLRPGLTGLAQISGRDTLTIQDKARLDGEYFKKVSFGLDVKIFFITIAKVLKADGIKEGKN